MKYFLLLIFSLFVLDGKGQDSVGFSSKSSVSFTGGTNIVYPGTKQLINNSTIGLSPN